MDFFSVSAPAGFKTKGLSCTEYRSLFTTAEKLRYDKAASNIEGSLAWLSGSVSADDDAYPVIGIHGFTYRDLLRTGKAAYEAAPPNDGFNMDNSQVYIGLVVMEKLGILDDATRKSTIMKGLPL